MKIVITAQDQATALNNYVQELYDLNVSISSDGLSDMTVEIEPVKSKPVKQEEPVVEKVDTERQAAEERADELGISYRSDIKTENLITRIEEEEERIATLARTPDPLPMDEEVEEYGMEEEEEQQNTGPNIFNITRTAEKDSTEEQEDKPRPNFFDKIKKKEA